MILLYFLYLPHSLMSLLPENVKTILLIYVCWSFTGIFFGNNLTEKCWFNPNQQFSFKYFVNLCFILKLFSKVSRVQTTPGKISSQEGVKSAAIVGVWCGYVGTSAWIHVDLIQINNSPSNILWIYASFWSYFQKYRGSRRSSVKKGLSRPL